MKKITLLFLFILCVNILYSQNNDRDKHPLYHDFLTDEIRTGVKKLLSYEPYSSNSELEKHFNSMNKTIDRYNKGNYEKDFKYLLTLDIPQKFLKEKFPDMSFDEDVFNIQHLSAHALADYYNEIGEYDLSIEYYKKSIFDYPIITTSGTRVFKDVERCIYDIAKVYRKAGRNDEAYAYLIALLVDSQNYSEGSTLSEYIEEDGVDKIKLKEDIDKAILTIKESKKYSYTIIFRGHEAFFMPMFGASVDAYKAVLNNKELYLNLK